MTLEERVKQLKNIQAQLPGTVAGIAKGATLRAIETATELTPPTQDDLRGTNTRSGEMKQRWKKDSRVDPIGAALSAGKECITVLANDMEYASYVNDGHRMDRHFVPGLYADPATGSLEYDADYAAGGGGLMVGTKTSYVPGLYMVDAAKKVYQETVESEAHKQIEKLFNG